MKKRNMKMKNLILVSVLLITVSALSFAQSSTANVTANVNATLTISNLTAMTFATVNQGQTVTIASNVAAAASFLVAGAANAATTITVTFPANLTFGANTLTFNGQIPRYNTVAGAPASTAFGALTGGSTNTSGTGNLWVYIGGQVVATAVQAVGSYSGVITCAVTQP
jgi:hypothetical protein